MQNGEYFWIKDVRGGTAPSWEPALYVPQGKAPDGRTIPERFIGPGGDCHVKVLGPKVIGPDELIVPAHLYREAIETLRDRFAMAALAGFGTGLSSDKTATICYQQADAMMAERVK